MDDDLFVASIVPDVALRLKVTFPRGEGHAGVYAVSGPEKPLDELRKYARGALLRGHLSPRFAFSATAKQRRAMAVPLEATAFCFVAPMETLHEALRYVSLSAHPWALVLLCGVVA